MASRSLALFAIAVLAAALACVPAVQANNLTCAYLIVTKTGDVNGAGSHAPAVAEFANAEGKSFKHTLKYVGDREYNFITSEYLNFEVADVCIPNICKLTLSMNGLHSWNAKYVVIASGGFVKSFDTNAWIRTGNVEFNECDTYLKSVV